MLETHLRRAATVLMKSAIRIAPPDAREWGLAMRSELIHVEGAWSGLMWALGGATVMAKHALLSLIFPGRRPGIAPDGGLFAKNVSPRTAALVAGGGFVLAGLLFFAAPPFRQGMRVSLEAWSVVFHLRGLNAQPRLAALAKRAEMQHDPEGLVFVAARLSPWEVRESARLAEEAVRLDPNLLWVYAVVAARQPQLPEIRQWVPGLERWDPQNALFPLIKATSIEMDHLKEASKLPPELWRSKLEEDRAWQSAMAAAFASQRFDDYSDRLKELDRRVVPRYGFNDPLALLLGGEPGITGYAYFDSQLYAKSLLRSGQTLESRGDRKGAAEKYWAVARFGQVIDSHRQPGFGLWASTTLQAMAYKQLQALSAKEGNHAEAALFSYLAAKFDPAGREQTSIREEWVFGREISSRNAAVLQISSLSVLIFSGFLVVAASILIADRLRGGQSRRARPGVTAIAFTSAVGLLVSSATIYLTYRPYWYIFQGAIVKGHWSQARDLLDFLMAIRFLPGYDLSVHLPVYFWAGVTLLGVTALLFILLRHFPGRPQVKKLQHNPRMP